MHHISQGSGPRVNFSHTLPPPFPTTFSQPNAHLADLTFYSPQSFPALNSSLVATV